MKAEQPGVLVLSHPDVRGGWERWYLLAADVHYDHPDCDRKLFKRHLEEAKERDAGVFLVGDTFDAMQGKGDPRSSYDELGLDYKADDYADRLVDVVSEELEPYKRQILAVWMGNHEHGALKHYGTNLVKRLARRLDAVAFGYSAMVRFKFEALEKKGRRTSRLMYAHHGAGGGGPVTKGTLKPSRRGLYLPDVDIVATGHIHEEWLFLIERVRVSNGNKIYFDKQMHIQLPTYKRDWSLDACNWPMSKEMTPKPVGAWWLQFYYRRDRPGRVGLRVEMAD